jgi:cation:H+ antiporter
MTAATFGLFVLGLVLLVAGAELLVRGASRLAVALGISPLVVGLTVVAFGTSSPELAVSLKGSLASEAEIALGNVVGSNIFNVLFILGACALITPLAVAQQLVRLDVPVMIVVSFLVLGTAWDETIGAPEGAILFAGIVAYTTFLVRQSRRETAEVRAEYEEAYGEAVPARPHWLLDVLLVLGGLVMLVIGARWLVDSAVALATSLGVSKTVVGLTIVAAGTSLPEVAASVMASIRGERDIAVGNVVGSNIYNLLAILGVAAMVAPGGIRVAPSFLAFDLPIMIAVAVACLPIFFTGYLIARWEGALFLLYYAAYTAYLVLAATDHPARDVLQTAMVAFVLPLTVVTLAVVSVRTWRARTERL